MISFKLILPSIIILMREQLILFFITKGLGELGLDSLGSGQVFKTKKRLQRYLHIVHQYSLHIGEFQTHNHINNYESNHFTK